MKDKLLYLWIRFGVRMGWVSPVVCSTHVGTYEYESEDNREQWDEGGDPCVYVMVMLE